MRYGGNLNPSHDARTADAEQETSQLHEAGEEGGGDGLHHHELHEDEGGGYHSKHTHPDGREEHADHPTYEHAAAHMDAMHGQGGDHEEPDMDDYQSGEEGQNLSEIYSRKASKQ